MIAGPSFQNIRTAVQGFRSDYGNWVLSENSNGLPFLEKTQDFSTLSWLDRTRLIAGSTVARAHEVAIKTLKAYDDLYQPITTKTLSDYFAAAAASDRQGYGQLERERSAVTGAYSTTVAIHRELMGSLSTLQRLMYAVTRFFLSWFETLPNLANYRGPILSMQMSPVITGPNIGGFSHDTLQYFVQPTFASSTDSMSPRQTLHFYQESDANTIATVSYGRGDNYTLGVSSIMQERDYNLPPGYIIQVLIETFYLHPAYTTMRIPQVMLTYHLGLTLEEIKAYGFGVDEARQEAVLYKLAEPIDGSYLSPDKTSKAMLSVFTRPCSWDDRIANLPILTTKQSPIYPPPADAGAGAAGAAV
jgi:hypothetical protein